MIENGELDPMKIVFTDEFLVYLGSSPNKLLNRDRSLSNRIIGLQFFTPQNSPLFDTG